MKSVASSRGLMLVLIVHFLLAAASTLSGQAAEPTMSDEEKRERIEQLYQKYRRKFADVDAMSPEQLKQALEEGRDLVLVDVRKPEEQAVSMIPGALTQKEFERQADTLAGKTVVTYCTIGYRSGLYARKLQKRGWEVFNLEGSLLLWTHFDGSLVDEAGSTRRLHVYGSDWSLEASDYEPVW